MKGTVGPDKDYNTHILINWSRGAIPYFVYSNTALPTK